MIKDIINKLYNECLINKINGYLIKPINFGNELFDRSIIKKNEAAIDTLLNESLKLIGLYGINKEVDIESLIKIKSLKKLASEIVLTEEINEAYMMYELSKRINDTSSYLDIKLRLDETNSSIMHAYLDDKYIGDAYLDIYVDQNEALIYEINFDNNHKAFTIKKEYDFDNNIKRLISYEDLDTGDRKYLKDLGKEKLEAGITIKENSQIKGYKLEISDDNLKVLNTTRNAKQDYLNVEQVKGFISKYKNGEINNFIMADAKNDKQGHYIGNLIKMNNEGIRLNKENKKHKKFYSEEEFTSSYNELLTHPKNQEILKHIIDKLDSQLIGFKKHIDRFYPELNEIIISDIKIDEDLIDFADVKGTIDDSKEKTL